MAPATPSQGLPSPPPRTPTTPSRSFPYTFAPHLPKLGTAKVRLRSNVFGLCTYIIIWWQRSLYATFKDSIVWIAGPAVSDESARWVIGYLENILFFVLAWNIAEAVFVINRAPPPLAVPPSTGLTSRTQAQRLGRARGSSLRYLSSTSQGSPLYSSTISPYLNASTPLSTPTRKGGSNASLSFASRSSRLNVSHSAPDPAGFGSSVASADSSFSTSSPLASYMGRHPPQNGRPLDGQVLKKLLDASDS